MIFNHYQATCGDKVFLVAPYWHKDGPPNYGAKEYRITTEAGVFVNYGLTLKSVKKGIRDFVGPDAPEVELKKLN